MYNDILNACQTRMLCIWDIHWNNALRPTNVLINFCQQIPPRFYTLNPCNLPDFPAMAGPFNMDHDIDRLCNKLFLDGYDCFLY